MKKVSGLVLVLMAVLVMTGCKKTGGAGKKLTITLAHNQTSLENPYVYGADKFKEEIERISGGQVEVILHHGTMGENESELIEKMEMGAINIVVTSPGFMTSVGIPEVDMLALLYLFDSFDHWASVLDGEFGGAMKDIISKKSGNRFIVLGFWSSSVRDYYGKKQVVTPADLRGLSLRGQSAQVMQQFWKNCGAIPTSIAWGELYQALQQGVVDAAENDYTNFMLKEHHKTPNGKYISETHHDFTTRLLITSGVFWNKINDEQRRWVTQAADAATLEEWAVTIRMMAESKAKVIADGAIVTNFEDVDIAAFRTIAVPIQDTFARDNNMVELLEMVRKIK
jgi:TRAP-type C4-dicarboxylate transport system substrate-binding protein